MYHCLKRYHGSILRTIKDIVSLILQKYNVDKGNSYMDSYPLITILRKQVLDIFKLDMQWFEELNELKTFMLCQMNSCFIKLYWLFLDTEIIECEYSYFSHVCTWYSKGKYICNISALKPVKTVTNLIKPHSLRDVLYFLSRVRSREPYFLKCFFLSWYDSLAKESHRKQFCMKVCT